MSSPSKYPQRSRKRNKLLFNDEEETPELPGGRSYPSPVVPSPLAAVNIKKEVDDGNYSTPGGSRSFAPRGGRGRGRGRGRGAGKATSTPLKSGVDPNGWRKIIAEERGKELRAILKLPKAHKWVCYEWFYSNMDQAIFLGENEFEVYLRQSFPNLKGRLMTRIEWGTIRRLMGKPRRCSGSFFTQERQILQQKREKIRILQRSSSVDINKYGDVPRNIPIAFTTGTRVSCFLRNPSDGLFVGIIDAVDSITGIHRVTFDRPGIATQSVPDYEIQTTLPPQFIHINQLKEKIKPKYNVTFPDRFRELIKQDCNALVADNMKGYIMVDKTELGANLKPKDRTMNGYPLPFLALMARFAKVLGCKKRALMDMKKMNDQAERMRALNQALPCNFLTRYSKNCIYLEALNSDLEEYLAAAKKFALDIPVDSKARITLQPELVEMKHLQTAKETVERNLGSCSITSDSTPIQLITKLISILIHLKDFSARDISSFDLQGLKHTIAQCKGNIDPENLKMFQDNVEIHVNHVQASLTRLGNLGVFKRGNDALSL